MASFSVVPLSSGPLLKLLLLAFLGLAGLNGVIRAVNVNREKEFFVGSLGPFWKRIGLVSIFVIIFAGSSGQVYAILFFRMQQLRILRLLKDYWKLFE